MTKLSENFYKQDAVTVAEKLLGKILVRKYEDGTILRVPITETEAYMGEEDKACHASKGCTSRTRVMYEDGGLIYVYFIYGMYWMLNIVTGTKDHPQAVLIRGIENINGPGRVARELNIDRSFYGENLLTSDRIWIEDAPDAQEFLTTPRIGINYAGEVWINMPWRFVLKEDV